MTKFREPILGSIAIAAGGSVTTSGVKLVDSGGAHVKFLVPGAVNSVLFLEASVDGSNYYQLEDTNGTPIYSNRGSITADRWWSPSGDQFGAHWVRIKSCASTAGTAGSAIAAGATFYYMGYT